MAFGMPPGFADLLRQKYSILQQQADATTTNATSNQTAAQAGARLDTARARELPADSAATRALQGRQGDLLREQATYFGPTALANIAESRSRIPLNEANAFQSLQQGLTLQDLLTTAAPANPFDRIPVGGARGSGRVSNSRGFVRPSGGPKTIDVRDLLEGRDRLGIGTP